jgi:hypothetical protein
MTSIWVFHKAGRSPAAANDSGDKFLGIGWVKNLLQVFGVATAGQAKKEMGGNS